MLNEAFRTVKQFNFLARRNIPRVPTMPDADLKAELAVRIYEEVDEFIEAKTMREMIDALIDILYVTLDACVQIGLRPSPFFEIIARNNLSKVWPDGWMQTNEKGKVIKPPTWIAPDAEIDAELARQMQRGIETPTA